MVREAREEDSSSQRGNFSEYIRKLKIVIIAFLMFFVALPFCFSEEDEKAEIIYKKKRDAYVSVDNSFANLHYFAERNGSSYVYSSYMYSFSYMMDFKLNENLNLGPRFCLSFSQDSKIVDWYRVKGHEFFNLCFDINHSINEYLLLEYYAGMGVARYLTDENKNFLCLLSGLSTGFKFASLRLSESISPSLYFILFAEYRKTQYFDILDYGARIRMRF